MEGNMDIIVNGYFLVSKGIQTRIYAAPNQDLSYFYTPKVEGSMWRLMWDRAL